MPLKPISEVLGKKTPSKSGLRPIGEVLGKREPKVTLDELMEPTEKAETPKPKVAEPYKRLSERNLESKPLGTSDAFLSGMMSGLMFGAGGEKLREEMPNHKLALGAGELAGSIAPFGGVYKAVNPLTKGIGNKLGRLAATGALAGAPVGATKATLEGKDAKGVAKEAALYGALGAVGDVAVEGLVAPLLKKGLDKIVKLPEVMPKKSLEPPKILGTQSPKPEVITPKIIQGKSKAQMLESKLNILEPPSLGDTGIKERRFAQNVRDSKVAPGVIKDNLDKNKLNYEPITNRDTFDKATKTVSDDAKKALELFNSPSNGVSADDVALGEALISKAIKEGNTEDANRLIADLATKLTTAGQAVQAASIFKRLTPEGMLLYAQRMINSANKDLFERLGNKAQKIVLTADDSQFILDKMKQVQHLPDGREKEIALAQVMQLIADKVPASGSEKVRGLQRISLLLNPKTMVRNTLGNTIFGAIDNLSNVVATPVDMLTSKFTGKRTTTLPSLTTQFKSGVKGVKETLEDAKLGIDTYSGKTQFELPSKRIFDFNTLDKLDRATRVGLQLGDRPFYNAAYDDTLRQQMKLSGITEPTQEMMEQAHKIAQQRTYQDTNALTQSFKKMQNALNFGRDFGLGNIVLPFVKTPANILKRAIEYSPVGITTAIKEAQKTGKGKFDQKTFVDSVARSVTGTALIMVGYDLAKKGMITGSANKDKDIAAFERNLGKSDFAFKVDNKYYTYDWAQPASMALAIGADVYLKGKDRKEAENVIGEAIKSGGETLFKQSLLQGLQRFMGGYSPIDNIANTALNAPTQFVPTVLKQITQLTDTNQRSIVNTDGVGTTLNNFKARIPGVSKTLEPKIDTFGKEIKNYQGKNNVFNVFLNPGLTTEFNPNKTQTEILRLYEKTGDRDLFPKVAPRSFTHKGEKVILTPPEITQFQKTMGQFTEKKMEPIAKSNRSDDAKVRLMIKAIEDAYEKAKKETLNNRKSRD